MGIYEFMNLGFFIIRIEDLGFMDLRVWDSGFWDWEFLDFVIF